MVVTLESLQAQNILIQQEAAKAKASYDLANPALDLKPGTIAPGSPAKPTAPVVDDLRPGDVVEAGKLPQLPVSKAQFESSYKGLIDGINDLSGQIDKKTAALEDPTLDPSQRMQLSIELQELMQMRLQMITITTNLLKTDHDSSQAVNNNLRVS